MSETIHTTCTPGEDFAYVRWVLSEPFRAKLLREFPDRTYFIAWESMQSRQRQREAVRAALTDEKDVQP